MRIYKYILYAFALALAAVGCKEKDDADPWGEKDDPDNYGVYFPSQSSSKDIQVEAAGKTEVTYKVRRTNILDPIIVPVVIRVNSGDEVVPNPEDVFDIEPIAFDAGEDETSFTVSFANAEVGKEYQCTISVEDPKYISLYGKKDTGLTFTLLRANWKLLGKGKWRDDIISSMYGGIVNMNAEVDVDIYEREDLPGYLRMKVFNTDYVYALYNQKLSTDDVWTVLDASNPDEVWFPRQSTGIQINASDGVINIASNVDRIFSMDASENAYGSLVDGIITFPIHGVLANLPGYSATGWYGVNASGLLRIMLPGAREYDYSLALTKSEPKDGAVKIAAVLGSDVAHASYKIYEGAMGDAQASLYAQELDESKAFDGNINESGTLEIKGMKTGKYTLVACTYNESETAMKGYAYVSFGYIAEGDDCPIILNIGLEGTNEYAGVGVNTDNSARFYAYGENIESIKWGLYRTSRLEGIDLRQSLENNGAYFTADELKEVNEGHYSTMITSLNGDSDYTIALLVNNGYVKDVLTATCKTTGKFNPLLENYTYADFLETLPKKDGLFGTTWSLYGVNLADDEPDFKKLGTVSFEEDITNDVYSSTEIIDFIKVKGLTMVPFDGEDPGVLCPFFPGTTSYSFMLGACGLYAPREPIGQANGSDIYVGFLPLEDPTNLYLGVGMFVGDVADGYMAIVPSPDAASQGFTFSYFAAFNSSAIYSILGEMILVDDSKVDASTLAAASSVSTTKKSYYKSLKNSVSERLNGERSYFREWTGSGISGKVYPENLLNTLELVHENSGRKDVSGAEVVFHAGTRSVSEPMVLRDMGISIRNK